MRCFIFILSFFIISQTQCQTNFLLIGTYTDSGSKGIYVYKFNQTTGKSELVTNTDSVKNPSFLIVSHDHKNIYAVNETNHDNPGAVSSFSFNQKTGALKFINKVNTGGDDPCYISVTKNKKWAIIANYSGGSTSAISINPDGSLAPLAQLIQDAGTSINKNRQEASHVHAAVLSPDEKYVFTPNLGTDKVKQYQFNANTKHPLKPASPPFTEVSPGSGPRHFTFSPDGKYAYLIQELTGSVVVYNYQNGTLKKIQTIITHPQDYKGEPGSADIHISPDGKFLYASNRGEENTISIFKINTSTGLLTTKGNVSCGGKTPRNFLIDPSGNYLLVANQNSDNIIVFKRDKTSGALKDMNQNISVPKPVCLQMTPKF